MESPLTWTQFATVIGLLAAVASLAGYFFKKWQDLAFGQILQRLDAIDNKLKGMVTKDELQVAVSQLRNEMLQMELRLKTETPPAAPGGPTS